MAILRLAPFCRDFCGNPVAGQRTYLRCAERDRISESRTGSGDLLPPLRLAEDRALGKKIGRLYRARR